MPLTLISGPANSGKAQRAMQAVREHIERGGEPLLVVPQRTDRALYLRELAGEDVALGATVVTFAALERELASCAPAPGPIDAAARDALVGAALRAAGARYVTRALVEGAGELLAAMRAKRVGERQLAQALAVAGGPVTLDINVLYAAYRRGLSRIGGVDREEWLRAAQDALTVKPGLWGDRAVVIYGFDDFTEAQVATIRTLARDVDAPVTVTLTYEPDRNALAARATIFQELAAFASEHVSVQASDEHYEPLARGPLSHLERWLFEPDAPTVEVRGAILLTAAPNRRAEMQGAVDAVASLLDEGLAPHEVAIVARQPAGIAQLAHELLDRAGIPHSLERELPLTAAALGRALLGLLSCAAGDGAAADLVAWLRAPGFVRTAGRVDAFEREVRRQGATSAADALALWRAMPQNEAFQLEKVDAVADSRSARSLYRLVETEVEHLLNAPLRGVGRPLGEERLAEVAAARAIGALIAGLRRLAERDEDLVPRDAAALREALEAVTFKVGRPPAEGLVQVTSPLQLRAQRVRAIVLVDMQEGSFPLADPRPRLLSDRRLSSLAAAGMPVLFRRSDTLAVERYLFYAALSRAAETLVVCWHTHDDDGRTVNRSLFVDDLLDLFDPPPVAHAPATAEPGEEMLGLASAVRPLRSRAVLDALAEYEWSPTSLEAWHRCPARWFVEKFLVADEPAAAAEAMTEGSVMHDVLKEVVLDLKEAGDARFGVATRVRALAAMRAALARHEHRLPGGGTLARIGRRRLEVNLQELLLRECDIETEYVPEHVELSFGARDGEPFDLGGGVRVNGRIDRIDARSDGTALVWDYKRTAKGADLSSAKWADSGSFQAAIYARAVEQLLGLDVHGTLYQPLLGSEVRPRGGITDDAVEGRSEIVVRTDVTDHPTLDERIQDAIDAARTAAIQARAGQLESRPLKCYGHCRYRSICRLPR